LRTSVAGPIAAHMQRQAILSRHEDTREALAQIGARGGVAARFREVAFPMASVKEHQSRTETFARGSILCDASAPQRLARRPYCLGPTVDSDQSESVGRLAANPSLSAFQNLGGRSDDHPQYPVEVLNRAADIFRMASHVLDQRLLPLLRLSHLVVSVVDDDPQPFPRRRDYASITRRRWTVTGPGSRLFSADLWRRRSPMAPSDSQPAATILQTESSRRSTTTDERCHPRPHLRSAA